MLGPLVHSLERLAKQLHQKENGFQNRVLWLVHFAYSGYCTGLLLLHYSAYQVRSVLQVVIRFFAPTIHPCCTQTFLLHQISRFEVNFASYYIGLLWC